MSEHEISELRQEIKELRDIITPMAETYQAASKVGKWAVGLVTFISIMFGIALALRELFRK
jgi:hypothetical protein